jgi:hypothetical protein
MPNEQPGRSVGAALPSVVKHEEGSVGVGYPTYP